MPGNVDPTIRPNQIFAVGGLPRNLLSSERSRDVVDAVESRLWTPMGLRTLDPRDPAYVGRYAGAPAERDEAYHQGTVWPWLLGSFVEAWVRVRGGSDAVREEARSRFLTPVLEHLACEGLGHVSEVCDGDEPHAPGGCPFQAWSLGELLRLDQSVLALPADVGNETRSGRRDVMAGFAE
jgi:glycogen debranching enzyme